MGNVKNCQKINEMGISVLLLFPVKSCSSANLLTWSKSVGIQEMQKSFFLHMRQTTVREAVITGVSAGLLESSLKMVPPVSLLELGIQLGLSRGPWDHGAAHGSPGNHSAAPSTKFSPLVFDFQANYLSTAAGKSTHQNQFNFLNCNHLSL